MPSTLPDGDPVPDDGPLTHDAVRAVLDDPRPFGAYLHVPFCTTRCGYCDFTTYTAEELGPGASRTSWAASIEQEIALARRALGAPVPGGLATVFVGGGTPTLLAPDVLGDVLDTLADAFGLAADAEITVEANPESVDAAALRRLRERGVTRVSFGMQSAVPHVLAALDRQHTPGRVAQVVAEAREAGFEQVSVDLIMGAPGESDDDWRRTIDAALALEPDHISAYALIVEPGTRLAAQVKRGEATPADDDTVAARYVVADEAFAAAGLDWYEVSNWARPGAECRHNLGYWRGDDWWGFGPGAHAHVRGTRWWNVKHPTQQAAALAAGRWPAAAREVLTVEQQRDEQVLLALRLSHGLDLAALTDAGRLRATRAVDEGLLDAQSFAAGRAVLTRSGRLLADRLAVDLLVA